MSPDEKVTAKRQAVMAVLDEDWPMVLKLVLELSNDSVDPETCGHEFERHDGLPNAVCKKCGSELLAGPRSYLGRESPLFREGNPPSQVDGIPKQPTVVDKPRDTPCPNRGLGHAWVIYDTYVDRCAACKATRPRPKRKAAPAGTFGDPSDL